MTDDFTRALAELQAAHSELMGAFIGGRRTDEALADYRKVLERAKAVQADLSKRASMLESAIHRAEGNTPMILVAA